MIIYISGPMSHRRDHNFPAFHACAAWLREHGYHVVNPAELDEGTDVTGWDWARFMERDLAVLETCDGVAVLENWQLSRGAVEEVKKAHELKLPVLTVDEWVFNYERETVPQ